MVSPAFIGATPAWAGTDLQGAGRDYSNTLGIVNDAAGDLTTLSTAHDKGDVLGMQQAGASYGKALVAWNSAVTAIDFPASVHRLVNRVSSTTRREVDDIAVLGRVPASNADRARVAADQVLVDDDAGATASAALKAALGLPSDPLPAAAIGHDRVMLAVDTYNYKARPHITAFNTAQAGRDLGATKSAQTTEMKDIKSLVSSIGGVALPASVHADVVNVRHAGGDLLAFYQRRIGAASPSALRALGGDDSYYGALTSHVQTLLDDLARLAS